MKKGRALLVSALVSVLALQSSFPFVKAQSSSGSGLSISPTRTELSIAPGASDVVKLNLRNVTGGDITAKVFVNDFESDNDSGEPRLVLDTSKQNPSSIRQFLGNIQDLNLKKGEEKTFTLAVNVPADAAPGAYYGVVRYAAVPAGNATPTPGQVSLTASVASIVLVEVSGNIREQVEFQRVLVFHEGNAGGFFVDKPNEIGVQVANKGNGFARPFGTVTVKNPFGKQVQAYEVNDVNPRNNVLPASNRIFKNPLKGVSLPGQYQITASISYGNGGEVLVQKKAFWYVPFWFIILLAVLISVIVGLVYRFRQRLPRTRHKRK